MSSQYDMYFLSKNYVNSDDTINVSSADLYKTRLYDQNYILQWISSGETSETGYDTYIEVIFYEGSNTINRTIDTFVLQNINLADFKIQYYTGGAYAEIPDSEAIFTTNIDTSKRIKLSNTITTSKIKLLMKGTITPSEEKKVGQFWVLLETYELENPHTTRTREDETMTGFQRMGNGDGVLWTLWDKWGKTYELEDLTDTQLLELEDIYRQHSLFTFYENYSRNIDLIKQVFWVEMFTGEDNPIQGIQLNTLTMKLVEK